MDRRACRCYRARLAQPSELRCRARHLYLCNHLRDLGCGVSLLGLDSEASNAHLLATGLAAFQGARSISWLRPSGGTSRNPPAVPDLHCETVDTPLGDASVDF